MPGQTARLQTNRLSTSYCLIYGDASDTDVPARGLFARVSRVIFSGMGRYFFLPHGGCSRDRWIANVGKAERFREPEPFAGGLRGPVVLGRRSEDQHRRQVRLPLGDQCPRHASQFVGPGASEATAGCDPGRCWKVPPAQGSCARLLGRHTTKTRQRAHPAHSRPRFRCMGPQTHY